MERHAFHPQRVLTLFVVGAVSLLGCEAAVPPDEPAAISVTADRAEELRDAGWPTMFGPSHNSHSYETRINGEWPYTGPPVIWRREGGKGYSVPLVHGNHGILFFRTGDTERLEAFDPETGQQIWKYDRPARFVCKWEYSDGPYGTPAIDGGQVFAIGAMGEVSAHDLESGHLLWERTLSEEYEAEENPFAVGTSPLVDGDLVIVNVGGTKTLENGRGTGIVALQRDTGETAWNVTQYGDSYATPKVADVHGQRMLFVLTFEALVVLNRDDGQVLFEFPYQVKGADRINAVSPLVYDDHVMMTGGPGPGMYVHKILPDGALEKVWNDRRAMDSQFNNLTRVGNYVYGFTSNWTRGALFRCVDIRSGDVCWEWESDVRRGGSLCVDNKLILLGADGYLACLRVNPAEPEVLSITREPILEPRTFTAPALANGRLYLRNEKELICLDLTSPPAKD